MDLSFQNKPNTPLFWWFAVFVPPFPPTPYQPPMGVL